MAICIIWLTIIVVCVFLLKHIVNQTYEVKTYTVSKICCAFAMLLPTELLKSAKVSGLALVPHITDLTFYYDLM